MQTKNLQMDCMKHAVKLFIKHTSRIESLRKRIFIINATVEKAETDLKKINNVLTEM